MTAVYIFIGIVAVALFVETTLFIKSMPQNL